MTSYTARDIKDLHELLGWGLRDCTRAFELAFDENSDIKDILQGDVVWAAGVVHASGLAINVKGGPNARTQLEYRGRRQARRDVSREPPRTQ
ncbi:hypothetical protein ACVIGB_000770 [Bradyrhizobium sp. USDA 4341]